ncbi:unnamed protein product [Caenorhabditis angaria]|uniref:Uncharacterized protein n=1 Tax=Caenorhabditis angaria TaxID=860376 RepID=A0A9P1N166_9PELO|nr:unnamed protein product [Caenorhabditis angaria]
MLLTKNQTHLTLNGNQDGDEERSKGYEWIAHITHNCNSKAEIRTFDVFDRKQLDKIPLNQNTKISFSVDLTDFETRSLWPIILYEKI